MQPTSLPLACKIFFALLVAGFLVSVAAAQTESLLRSFSGATTDGSVPYAGLVADTKGNFYGTTVAGGSGTSCNLGCGTVFKITANGKETVMHSFAGGTTDGAAPYGPLVVDVSGNLYGTTSSGGPNGAGTVFKLTPTGTETILYSFGAPLSGDGSSPRGRLAMDAAGNLYGTTFEGGAHYVGTVFEVTPSGTETILYSFTGGTDGGYPFGGVVQDKNGNLYGTTYMAGEDGFGTVFELSATGTETVLYSFKGGSDGEFPAAAPVLDTKGNLYGTTEGGGKHAEGTVYRVAPATSTEIVLYSFGSAANDGAQPYAGVILDAKNNVYGTTITGGAFGNGIAYKVTPTGVESILHSFGASGDGLDPYGGLIVTATGDLYGTTALGGTDDLGTIFRIVP